MVKYVSAVEAVTIDQLQS